MKAEAEDRLAELKLARLANVRPAAILSMHPTGAARGLPTPLLQVIPSLGIRSFDLGRAMLRGAWVARIPQASRSAPNRVEPHHAVPNQGLDHLVRASFWGAKSCSR
ncbi:hypothetical protein MYSTI_01601 [Myxococcus stipitatus DSM 14675]|uniref:Uncharacterized protein n=1 Tax=Myxococcus stipitatus (strain DSM 14675 / JCM 12634 / Mx s8) TaxID=1278073 RepID=L7U930_MYXSD|nr:hypothetical protein [Myxococcus stipitatus]AGC42934.1 hypothetical protein MYSTI_01601 [Myxococcus stipitatus DSM 14675]